MSNKSAPAGAQHAATTMQPPTAQPPRRMPRSAAAVPSSQGALDGADGPLRSPAAAKCQWALAKHTTPECRAAQAQT